ncbi:MAG: phosphotransferase family protein, partial [Actinocrinis sp.]
MILHEGFDRTLIDGDFLVLSAVEGVTWHSVEKRLEADGSASARRRELGAMAARLHAVTNPAGLFGYPAVPELSASSWPDAFSAMMDAMLDDAVRYGAALPIPAGGLRALVARNIGVLETITGPALVHFDLWPGNVMVADAPPRISGLI